MGSRLSHRLFIALLICVGLAVLCWKVLPRFSVDIPWWVPVSGFVVILFASVAAPRNPDDDDPDDQSGDGGPEGISAADRERFG